MSTAVTKPGTKAMAALPASMKKYVEEHDTSKEVSGGITSGFPIISIRGKVWRVRSGGVETDLVDDEGEPVPNVRLVLVKSNPLPSKIYYDKKYESGSNEAPTCWSSGGVKPDANVQKKVNPVCATCPKNVWGSKITEDGKKTRACADVRRVAVVSEGELNNWVEDNTAELPVHLLRVPAASLNPLKDYAEKILKPRGFPYFGVVTKVGFDATAEYPKMKFTAVGVVSEEMAGKIIELRDSEDVRRILAEAEEFAGAGTTDPSEASAENDESGEEATTAPAPAASRKKAAAKPRAAEEEDVGLEEEAVEEEAAEEEEAPPPPKKRTGFGAPAAKPAAAPKPAPKPAAKPAPAATDDDEEGIFGEEGEEEAAPPPKKAAAKPAAAKTAAAPAKVAPKKKAAAPPPEEVEEAAEGEAEDGGDFDAMLDSILK